MLALSSRVRPIVVGLVAILLALHAWLAVSATINLGVTGDETVHLTGGYSYWRFNDYRLHPENGNLPQRWAALPLLISKPRLEPETRPELWQHSDVWRIGQNFFFESGNSIDYLLLCARSMSVVWSVATGLLVFFWSRSLWGEIGGLFSLLLYVVSPTMLAHGPLVTSDMCATFWLLAATGAWWRLSERIDGRRLGLSLITVGLAAVAKFSFVLLFPIFGLIILWRTIQGKPVVVSWKRSPVGRPVAGAGGKLAVLSVAGIAHLIAAAVVIWAFFGFRYTGFAAELPAAESFFSSSDAMLPATCPARWIFLQARKAHLLPEAFLHGFSYVLYAARERGSFLAGEYSNTGWWWFFPFAFLVKSSLAEIFVFASLPFVWTFRWLRDRTNAIRRVEPLAPLILFAAVYGIVSLTSNLNIGQRHILPLYPILFIFAGALAASADGRVALRGSAGIIAPARFNPTPSPSKAGVLFAISISSLAIIESASIRPNYLAFFNQLAGGPKNGWRLLGDSSLDWGQNLPRLADWIAVHRKPAEPVYLSYFGADDPFYRSIQPIELSPYFSFGRVLHWEPLGEGLYCVGASMLQDASSAYSGPWSRGREALYQRLKQTVEDEISREMRSPTFGVGVSNDLELSSLDRLRFARLCVYLRVRKPDAVIGNMIFVHRLSNEEIRRAVDGTLDELIELVESTAFAADRQGN